MSSWRECKLGEVIEIIGGGTPKTSISEYWNGNIPWLSVVDFNTGKKYVSKTEKTITEEGLKNSSTKLLQKNDIIISARGTVGALAMLDKPMTFNQSCYGIRAKENESTNDYIFYLLKDTVNQLLQISHGGVFDTITKATFDEIDISLPPLEEQKAIAEVLSSLDAKIDLLHRQNQTLESLAQTLFRQWFIEEAKEEWKEIRLGDYIKTELGGTPNTSKAEYWDGIIPWINSGEINKFRIIQPTKYITEIGLNKSSTKLLPKGTTVLAITGATLGQVSLLEIDSCANQSVVGIIPNDVFSKEFIYLLIKEKINEIISNQTGGAQQHINKNDINATLMIKPDELFMKSKAQMLQPYFEKISLNVQQIQTLENLRDSFLPKLLSGEVRVKFDN